MGLNVDKSDDEFERSMKELKELTKYYLEHEEERKEIARAGYEIVKNKGSVLLRVVEMIKIIH